VAGRLVVENGVATHPDLPEMLVRHRAISTRIQKPPATKERRS
jgi:hypothetical protein